MPAACDFSINIKGTATTFDNLNPVITTFPISSFCSYTPSTFTVTENGNVIYVANEQKAHSYRAYSLAYDKSISEPGSTYFENIYGNGKINFIVSVILSGIALTYLILIKTLFLNPLKSHSEWIEKNGIFSSKSKSSISQIKTSDINIMKSEKLKQYSVADELLKWTKLKDGGHISEDEFNEAREKILKRN